MPGFLEGTVKLIELHKSERWRGDAFVIRSELTPLLNRLNENIRNLISLERKAIGEVSAATAEIYSSERLKFIIAGLLVAIVISVLALNAPVEAARAGEQGRGFAVVATEVRNLASRSATAAKEIKELIQDSVHKVHAGSELVNRSGDTLGKIVDEVKQVGTIVAEIASASSEQASGIDQINRAVSEMDQMTQQNANLAQQTSSASTAMNAKTQEMRERIGFFKL